MMTPSVFLFASKGFKLGGENGDFWRVGNEVSIYWDSHDFASNQVNIYLWDKYETKLKIISLLVNNNGKYLWLIPDSLADGFYKIKIVSTNQLKKYIISDNYFKIYQRQNSLEEKISFNSIKTPSVFPNPAYSTTRVKLQQEGQVAITAVDLLGRSFPLWSGYASTGDMELDVSTLPTGSYTLLIDYGTKREAVRLMKE